MEWRKDKPIDDKMVLVSIKDDAADKPCYSTSCGFHYKDIWIVDNETTNQVNAWMDFPEPLVE